MKMYLKLLILFIGSSLTAQNIPLEIKKDFWNWGILPFETINLPNESKPLGITLPQRLISSFKNLPDHTYSEEEKKELQMDFWKKTLWEEEKNLSNLENQKSQFFFKQDKKESEILDLNKRIDTSKNRVLELKTSGFSSVLIQSSSKAKHQESSSTPYLLENSTNTSPNIFLKLKNLDLLITGKIFYIQNYLKIEIYFWRSPNGALVKQIDDFFSLEEIDSRIGVLQKKIVSTLLGREWAALKVTTTPIDSYIYLNKEFKGQGQAEELFLKPGTYLLRIERSGLVPLQSELILKNEDILNLSPSLPLRDMVTLKLESEPSGADVYVGSLWLGKTPLNLSPPPQISLLEIKFPGKESFSDNFKNQKEYQKIELSPLAYRITVQEAKDNFFNKMTFFTFSFISTVWFRALDNTYTGLYNSYLQKFLLSPTTSGKQHLDEAYTWQQLFQNGSKIGIGMTIGLFAWLLWDLFIYIDATERDSR